MELNRFDYIFTGGGCAAMSLIYQVLQHEDLKNKKILILEKEPKDKNDRTWCFWEVGEGPFEHVVEKSWSVAWFHSPGFSRLLDMKPYFYKMIRADRFYSFVKEFISGFPNVTWLEATVDSSYEKEDQIFVESTQGIFKSGFLFNSIPPPLSKIKGHFYLLQHFKGWVIRTKEPIFNPEEPTLMDFRIHQNNECRFMYVLPVSPTEALVEFTVFSENHLNPEEYDSALKSYLSDQLVLNEYEILHTEFGSIPMFSAPFEKHIGKRIINIGTAGGQTKASSGYTFTRIQKHSVLLASALNKTGSPFIANRSGENRFAFYDKVLLHVLANKKVAASQVFRNMFKYNSPQSVFRFLDEDTHFLHEYRLLNTMPIFKFIGPGFKELLGI